MTITATAHGRRQQLDEANERARNARAAQEEARDVPEAAGAGTQRPRRAEKDPGAGRAEIR